MASENPFRRKDICKACDFWFPDGGEHKRATAMWGTCNMDGKLHRPGSGCDNWIPDWDWARRPKPQED